MFERARTKEVEKVNNQSVLDGHRDKYRVHICKVFQECDNNNQSTHLYDKINIFNNTPKDSLMNF